MIQNPVFMPLKPWCPQEIACRHRYQEIRDIKSKSYQVRLEIIQLTGYLEIRYQNGIHPGRDFMSWSFVQYSKFESERNRPARDLLARIPTATVHRAADIGCGPGNSTELLRDQYPDAIIMGMDSSPDMIAAARKRIPSIRFELDDIYTWREEGPFDLILAKAALQWVPDHDTLFPALIGKLAAGGSLAVQMPDNFDEPSHRLMRETAAGGSRGRKLAAAD